MKKFEDYMRVILMQEGGSKFTNDKDDPGGATKYGISLRFLKGTGSDGDIDNDGDIDIDDIKKLDETKSSKLYKEYFWDKMNLDLIDNELLKLHLFSHGVNAGNSVAVKILQKILGVTVDGKLGRTTAMVANAYSNQPKLVQGYASARKVYYDNIVAKNAALKKYIKGWYNRVDSTKF